MGNVGFDRIATDEKFLLDVFRVTTFCEKNEDLRLAFGEPVIFCKRCSALTEGRAIFRGLDGERFGVVDHESRKGFLGRRIVCAVESECGD